MSVCKSCGKPIDWIKTEKGKFMPVDFEYVEWEDAEPKDILITDTGKVFAVEGDAPWQNFKGRVSHFSTCPQAGEWRKSKQ